MSDVEFKQFLDQLVPENIMVPVKLPMKPARLVIDENLYNKNPDLYINGVYDERVVDNDGNPETISSRYRAGLQILDDHDFSNVTHLAYWKASSFKSGNGIANAIDDNFDSFWQSDGIQPHTVEVYFSKRMDIVLIAMFLTLSADESYTPRIINIHAGHSPSDAVFYKTLEVNNVNGWVALTFEDNLPREQLLKCQYLRFTFPINHENGKDTHLRGIRIYTQSKDKNTQQDVPRLQPSLKTLDEFSLR
ncbi:Uncharacterized protein RNJ44_04308 [Nakaseomyces bracarensis]|uniref:DOC domain-containing protein n=1 Tax=Nakaseomyces bracarensis TaxID=273131 RepID=A0ABR4NUK3_9SACH